MATRQEIQAALDLIRFVNIANDLFDVSTQVAAGNVQIVNTQSSAYVAPAQDGTSTAAPMLLPPTLVAMTDIDIQNNLTQTMSNIQGYINTVNAYLADSDNVTTVTNGLTALGVNLSDIQTDITNYQAQVTATNNALTAGTPSATIGTSIASAVTPLNLVRNAAG